MAVIIGSQLATKSDVDILIIIGTALDILGIFMVIDSIVTGIRNHRKNEAKD